MILLKNKLYLFQNGLKYKLVLINNFINFTSYVQYLVKLMKICYNMYFIL
jgi:hypothetical protein